jgi:hypothetical protein
VPTLSFVEPFLFKFLLVLMLKDILHILPLYGLNSLSYYNPKLTSEEIKCLVLYITDLTVHGTTKNQDVCPFLQCPTLFRFAGFDRY